MPKFLISVNYIGDGPKALIRDGGSGRLEVIERLVASGGGTIESVYFALGGTDLFMIADVPDVESAAAMSVTARASGAVQVSTTQLMTVEQVDTVAAKARELAAPSFQ